MELITCCVRGLKPPARLLWRVHSYAARSSLSRKTCRRHVF